MSAAVIGWSTMKRYDPAEATPISAPTARSSHLRWVEQLPERPVAFGVTARYWLNHGFGGLDGTLWGV